MGYVDSMLLYIAIVQGGIILNPAQQKFHQFILERVQEDKMDEVQELLKESFQKQVDKSFDQAYLLEFMPRMKACLKPEHVVEVEQIMKEFGDKFTR